jgi:hypothetical protein
MKKNGMLLLFVSVAGFCLLSFQNCSNAKFVKLDSELSKIASDESVDSPYSSLNWQVVSGRTRAEYRYGASLQIDFASKTMTATSSKGTSVTDLRLPAAKTIVLTNDQIRNIISLAAQIQTRFCEQGETSAYADVGYNRLRFELAQPALVPEPEQGEVNIQVQKQISTVPGDGWTYQDNSDCTSTSDIKSVGGYNELTDYLLSL